MALETLSTRTSQPRRLWDFCCVTCNTDCNRQPPGGMPALPSLGAGAIWVYSAIYSSRAPRPPLQYVFRVAIAQRPVQRAFAHAAAGPDQNQARSGLDCNTGFRCGITRGLYDHAIMRLSANQNINGNPCDKLCYQTPAIMQTDPAKVVTARQIRKHNMGSLRGFIPPASCFSLSIPASSLSFTSSAA